MPSGSSSKASSPAVERNNKSCCSKLKVATYIILFHFSMIWPPPLLDNWTQGHWVPILISSNFCFSCARIKTIFLRFSLVCRFDFIYSFICKKKSTQKHLCSSLSDVIHRLKRRESESPSIWAIKWKRESSVVKHLIRDWSGLVLMLLT